MTDRQDAAVRAAARVRHRKAIRQDRERGWQPGNAPRERRSFVSPWTQP